MAKFKTQDTGQKYNVLKTKHMMDRDLTKTQVVWITDRLCTITAVYEEVTSLNIM